MAIFKPEGSTLSGNFQGIVEVGIINFTNRAGEFDWADIFIDMELSVKNSEYSNKLSILGELERDTSGKINGGSVLKRMYRIFDAIGCSAGMNIDGKFEDEHGNAIDSIS